MQERRKRRQSSKEGSERRHKYLSRFGMAQERRQRRQSSKEGSVRHHKYQARFGTGGDESVADLHIVDESLSELLQPALVELLHLQGSKAHLLCGETEKDRLW